MATDYTQWQPEALAQIIAFREKSMEQFAERIASLEADNARLRERADAAEGLVRVATELTRNASGNTGVKGLLYISEVDFARLATALAAYKQAQGK
jgi:hypothetical protein